MGLSARKADKLSILRSARLEDKIVMTASAATKGFVIAPCDGELVDVIMSQPIPGANGTSIAATLTKRTANVAMLATEPVLTVAAAAYAAVDARKKIAAISGCTRPVITATKANRRVKKGDQVEITITPTGTYSATFPTVLIALIFNADL
jgi:hypothetical protein